MIFKYEVTTILIPHHATHQNASFSGPARQMGAGAGGLGAFALRMGRVAIPVVRRYILPVAKQLGRNLLEAAVPEIGQVLAGKKRPSGKMLKHVAETATKKTVKTSAPRFSGRSAGARLHRSGRCVPEADGCQAAEWRASGWPEWAGGGPAVQIESDGSFQQHHCPNQQRHKSFPNPVPPREVGQIFCLKFSLLDRKTTTTTKENSKQSGPTNSSNNNDFFW